MFQGRPSPTPPHADDAREEALRDHMKRLEDAIAAGNGNWDTIVPGGHPMGGRVTTFIWPLVAPISRGCGKFLLHMQADDGSNSHFEFMVLFYSIFSVMAVEKAQAEMPEHARGSPAAELSWSIGTAGWCLTASACVAGLLSAAHAYFILQTVPVWRQRMLLKRYPRIISLAYSFGPTSFVCLIASFLADQFSFILSPTLTHAEHVARCVGVCVFALTMGCAYFMNLLMLRLTMRPWEYAIQLVIEAEISQGADADRPTKQTNASSAKDNPVHGDYLKVGRVASEGCTRRNAWDAYRPATH